MAARRKLKKKMHTRISKSSQRAILEAHGNLARVGLALSKLLDDVTLGRSNYRQKSTGY